MAEVTTREAIEAAFDKHSDDAVEPASEVVEAPAVEPQPGAQPAEPPAPSELERAPVGDRVRDALGRFTGKPVGGAPKQEAPQGEQPQQSSDQVPAPERAPVNVPPQLREHWGALPQGFRDYTVQREAQVQQLLQNTSRERGIAHTFMQAVQPYQQAIQIEAGGDPIRAVVSLMDTATRLRFGTPTEKAALAAQIIKAYAVDIEALDNALVGVVQPQANGHALPDVRGLIRNELAPYLQQAQARRAEEQQRIEQEVQAELQGFGSDPKHEFFEDVREDMADILDSPRGRGMSLDAAYERACLLHPEVSKIMLARQGQQSAQSLTQAAQRAKAAAVSVRGAAPVGNPAPSEPSSVRDAIEAAIEAHSRV